MVWQPGQSGNPAGSTKRKIWRDAIERAIKRREETDPLAMEKLADQLIKGVETGDIGAIKEFGDRVDGKVPQAIVGDADHPAVINYREWTEWMKLLPAPLPELTGPESSSSPTTNEQPDSPSS